MQLRRYRSAAAVALLTAATALTLILAARTFFYLFHFVTNVPYADLWVLLDEVRAVHAGHSGWGYLWSPYWGHRPVFPRLLILLSVDFLHYSMRPFIVTSMAAQLSLVVIMLRAIRQLFQDRCRLFWLSAIAAVHLLLSSLQMEIFIEGLNIMYTVGYASAIAAILILAAAIGPRPAFRTRFSIALCLAILATGFVGIGVSVWPIMILESLLLRVPRKYLAILTIFTALILTVYSIGYTRAPEMGMGITGALHHPFQAACLAAFVLGGPISLYQPWGGIAVGAVGIASAFGIALHFARTRTAPPAAIGLLWVVLFLLGSAAGVALGRLTPEVLAGHTGQPVSRYFGPAFIFWVALFPVALTCWNNALAGRLEAAAVAAIVLILTFGTVSLQWRMSRAWGSVSETYDAIASGFLVGVPDSEYMSHILPDTDLMSRMVGYMRERHLSVFAEPRAHWMGRNIASIAPLDKRTSCQAAITSVPLGDRPPAFRVTGPLTLNGRPASRLLDLLIADDAGIVTGLARTYDPPGARILGYTRGLSTHGLHLFVLDCGRLSPCSTSGGL